MQPLLRHALLLTSLVLLTSSAAAGADRTVCAAGAPACMYSSVQAAVNAAVDGDTIVLQSGEVFIQSIILPATAHAVPVVIGSSAPCPPGG